MTSDHDPGITSIPSQASVDQTVEALTKTLAAKNITLFALVDHSGEAAKVGMTMPPTKLLIFGSPRAGTPIMLAAPTAALDLPLKILVSRRSQRQSVDHLQRPVLPAATPRHSRRFVAEHRGHRSRWRAAPPDSSATGTTSPRYCTR